MYYGKYSNPSLGLVYGRSRAHVSTQLISTPVPRWGILEN
jgi:hypothetical protein